MGHTIIETVAKTIGDLRKLLAHLPDDAKFEIVYVGNSYNEEFSGISVDARRTSKHTVSLDLHY